MTSSIILCLQNILGQDTHVAVEPEDDFHTFMERARSILGKDLDISSITGRHEVSLTDNVYQFILRSQVVVDSESPEPSYDNLQPESQQLSLAHELVQPDDDEETVYVLSDAHVLYNNDGGDEMMTADNGTLKVEGLQLNSGEAYKCYSFSYKCAENGFENQNSGIPRTFEIVDTEISYYGDGNSEKTSQKDYIANNVTSSRTKERIDNRNGKPNAKSNVHKVGNKCHLCNLYITSNVFLTYIFDASDQKDMRKSGNRKMKDSPKVICSACLNRDYDKCDGMPKTLGDNDFLVIKNNVQMIYKKKVNRATEDFKPVPKLLNAMVQVKEDQKNAGEPSESYIVKKEDGCFDIIGEPTEAQLDGRSDMVIKTEDFERDNGRLNVVMKSEDCEHVDYLYSCRLCGLQYSQLPLVHGLAHTLTTASQEIYPCVLCEFGYTSYGELVDHMRAVHQKGETAGEGDGEEQEQEGMRLLRRVLEGQRGAGGSGEWLDEGTGVFLSISRKDDKSREVQQLQNTDRKETDSDSESGVWIVQADSVPEDGAPPDDSGEHAGTVLAPRMFQCAVCKKRYSSPERLTRHACNVKSQKPRRRPGEPPVPAAPAASPDPTEDAQHTCGICQQTFHTKIRLQFHIRHLHCGSSARPILRCSACPGLTFPGEAALYDHIHFSHPRVRRHRCTQEGCQREFLLKCREESDGKERADSPMGVCYRASLTTHLRCHAGERSHRCDECGKKFLDRQTLTEHRVTHLKVKPFQCHICLKYLNRRSRLRMHLLTHQSEPAVARVLACQHCNMAFKDQSQAEAHVNDSGECSENIDCNPDDPAQHEGDFALSKNEDDVIAECRSSSDAAENGFMRNELVSDAKEMGQNDDLDRERNGQNEVNSKSKSNNRQCRLNQVRGWRSAEGEPTREEMLAPLSEKAKMCIAVVEIDKAYRCEYCERVYSSQQSLNLHRGSHQGQRSPFVCHVCGATFTTYSRCTTHKTTHGFYRSRAASAHSEAPAPQYDSFPVVKHFLCEVCGKSYLHWTYLQVHRRQKHSDNVHMYKCRSCGDEFPNSWGIAYHRKKVHGQSSGSAPAGESTLSTVEKFHYSCPECGAVLKTKAQLFLHRRAEHPPSSSPPKQGLFSCGQCDKRYITKVGLKGHMKTHELKEGGERHHRCQECGKTFVHATGLNTHTRRVHLREMNFSCAQCGKAFYSACDLQSHARRHTGERPFPCEACGRCFRTRGMRNEHLRIHTGERPFPCTVCGLAFRRSYALKSHQLIHQGGRKHACAACARLFRLRAELNTHMRHTHGLEPDVYTAENGVKGDNVESYSASHVTTGSTTDRGGRVVPGAADAIEINALQNIADISQYPERSGGHARIPKRPGAALNGGNLILENDIEILTAIFEDGPQTDFGSETTIEMADTAFLRNEDVTAAGGYILNAGGEGAATGALLAVEPDGRLRYDVDMMEKTREFAGWRGEGGDGCKSPDDARRFNDLFRSHQ